MEIKITNKIEEKINEYQRETGATKKWLCDKIGISTSRLYQIMSANNMMLDVVVRMALVLNCKVDDLIEYKKIEK